MDKEIIPAFYPFNFCPRMAFTTALRAEMWRIWVFLLSKSSACVVTSAHSVSSNYSQVQHRERVTLTLFLIVHFCNLISAPHFVTAADSAALLSFNQNLSFLRDALLPPLVRSVEFSFSHSTAAYSKPCSLWVCVHVCVNVCVLHPHVSIPCSFVYYFVGLDHFSMSLQPSPLEPLLMR